MCPHCGYNLAADETVTDGAWSVSPGAITFDGVPLALTPAERAAIYTLAKVKNHVVSREVIGSRVGHSENPAEVARVYLGRAKRKFPHLPIENVWGEGYRWVSGPTPYLGPYPNRSFRNEAEVMAGEHGVLRRLAGAQADVARLTAEAIQLGLIEPARATPSGASGSRPATAPHGCGAALCSDASFHTAEVADA